MGRSGNARGVHLHFEIRNKDNNLLPYVKSDDDYTPIIGLFGKDINQWTFAGNNWKLYYGGI